MNKLFFRLSLLFLLVGVTFISCTKDEFNNENIVNKSETRKNERTNQSKSVFRDVTDVVLDHIKVIDTGGRDLQNFTYDVTNTVWIGDVPVDGIHISGTVMHQEPNDDGGENIICKASSATCYSRK